MNHSTDMAKLNAQFFETISTVCSLIDVLVYMNNTSLSGHLRELKNKRKVQSGNPKVVAVATRAVAYESFLLQSHSSNSDSPRWL